MLQVVKKKIVHFFRRNLHGQTLVLPVSSDLIGNMMEFSSYETLALSSNFSEYFR